MKVTLTFLFTVIAFLSLGQFKVGELGTLDGQVIGGFIQVIGAADGTQVCQFKDNAFSQVVEYIPGQIIFYQLVGANPYFSGTVEESGVVKHFFFERIVVGKLSLYTFQQRLFFSLDKGPFTEITSSNYKDVLAVPFAECDYAQSALRKLKFDQTHLSKVLNQYNECVKSKSPHTFLPRKMVTARYGVFAGLDNSTVTFEKSTTTPTFSGQSLSNIKPFTIGVQAWMGLPVIPTQVRLILGLNYASKQYNGLSKSGSTNYVNNLYFSEFQFPIRLQYTFIERKKLAFFLSLGTSLSAIQGFESSQIWDTPSGNNVYINEIAPFSSLDKGMDIYGGMGCTLGLSKISKIVVSLSYATGTATFANGTNDPAKSTFGTLSFSTGYLF